MTLRSSIFGKLLLASIGLIAVALGSADFLLTRYTAEHERAVVQRHMSQLVRIVAPALPGVPPQDVEKWAQQTDSETGSRVTLIDGRGVVVADSRHDPETMENHAGRPEVRSALAGRPGSSIRRSATLDVDYYYFAVPVELPGRGRAVLRLALPLDQVRDSISAVRILVLRASALAALIALLIAYSIARVFTYRIRRIQAYASELVKAEYSAAVRDEPDDELGSVSLSLRAMAEHFRKMLGLLRRESARREAILSGMVEGVLAVDRNLRITFYNDAFARAVHARTLAPEGLPVLQFVRDPALHDLLGRAISTRAPVHGRIALIPAGGRAFEVQAAPLEEDGGTGAIATFHDVTELERLERVRKDFVANISHELRTPLAAIHGFTETLLEGALGDPQNNRRFLEIIAANTTRLSDLASDLLALSEIEAERMPVPAESIAVLEAAESALQMVEAQARARSVRAFLGDAEDVSVAGQKFRLERAITNLLLNGINYNRQGGEVRLDVRRVEGKVRISVTDTGIGIPPDDIPRIFERFYRVDKARSRQTGGTGLGLSIVRHTVERMGGSVTVDSRLGQGSVFTLIFPAA